MNPEFGGRWSKERAEPIAAVTRRGALLCAQAVGTPRCLGAGLTARGTTVEDANVGHGAGHNHSPSKPATSYAFFCSIVS